MMGRTVFEAALILTLSRGERGSERIGRIQSMAEGVKATGRRRFARWWPWAVLALAVAPAAWHVLDFEDDIDPEYPAVARPTFSRRPPAAYRLAEPGDTIDRIALYLAAGAVVLAATGWATRSRHGGADLWPVAVPLGLIALWHAATPGPTFDGWHGLGWRAIADPAAPPGLRVALAATLLTLAAWASDSARAARGRWGELAGRRRVDGSFQLLIAAAVLVALRQVEIPGVEPAGYWPRWAFAWGMLAFDLALIRAFPPWPTRRGWRPVAAGAAGWAGLIAAGLALTWLHRPLDRFKAVDPGRIYISAMPTYRGLEVAHARHHFRTIVNLFPEAMPGRRSPHQADEARFAREHGIRYVVSPLEAAKSEAFLDLNLALARDPAAWPILVHCHACMDRTPAWTGIYRFVVQGRPLAEILRELERHRGYRPKASVTLLYNRVLPRLAPEHAAADPTAALLRRCASGTRDPYYDDVRAEAAANPGPEPRVSQRAGAGGSTRRP